MQWNKTPCAFLQQKVRAVQNQEQTQEVRLPEGMPDIGRVLCTWGQSLLRSKQWQSDHMMVTGGVTGFVLYEPEDGGAPRMVQCWLPFQAKWSFPDSKHEGIIRCRSVVRSMDARTLSSRKMMVRCTVGLLGEALEAASTDIYIPTEVPEDVELLTNSYPVRLPSEAGELLVNMDEAIDLPGAKELIAWDLEPVITEENVVGQRVVFKGSARLHLVYMGEDDRIHSGYYDLPFAQYAQLDQDHDKEAEVATMLEVSGLEPELTEDQVQVKAGLVAQYMIYDQHLLQLAQDAYSPYRTVDPAMEMLELPVLLEQLQRPLEAQGSLESAVSQVVDTRAYPDHPVQFRQEKGLSVEVPGAIQVLGYDAEGKLQAATENWAASLELPAGQGCQVCSQVAQMGPVQTNVAGGQMTYRLPMQLQLDTICQQAFPMMTGLQLGELAERDPERPSLILRRAEDMDLWAIAKACGSTVEAIKKANGLASDPSPDQMLLIPVV